MPKKAAAPKVKPKPATKARAKATSKARTRAVAVPAAAAAAAPAPVLVVNMIPKSLSSETNQDSEPMLAVNPNNTNHIVGTAFTPDPMGGSLAPYYQSLDGGNTWTLNSVIPGGQMTQDITVAFSGTGDRLYAGTLRPDSPSPGTTRFNILKKDPFNTAIPMDVVEDRPDPDQPFTQAATVAAGPDAGKERVYVGNNDFAAAPQTATLDMLLDAGVAVPATTTVRLEQRSTAGAGQDGPQVRPVVHPDGTVYAAFYGWRSTAGNFQANTLKVTSDVVVVRDDNWGTGAGPFQSLTDPADGLPGLLVATGVTFGFDQTGLVANGQQRLGGTLAIAVDPRPGQSGTVYLAWGSDDPVTGFTIHVRHSTDRGVTWDGADLLTLATATNAALAVNSAGVVGLLYQQLSGTGLAQRWSTHLQRSTDGGTTWTKTDLADTPASRPTKTFDPYLGDYVHLLAVGTTFYGIFSANNTPDLANFPSGVVFQRNVDTVSHRLLSLSGTTQIPPSIDPFFFRV